MKQFERIVEYQRGDYVISTDKTKLDTALIHDYLSRQSYWAQGRSREVVVKSIKHSLCFGVYSATQQVGFARVVTDYATFSWVCDLFILETHRGHSLGKWLVECIVGYPELQEVKQSLLATQDAHELYRHYGGFQSLQAPEKWMVRRKKEDRN
ncbi:MAG: GNAT family N-acetyltransferase [Chloroflexi bacterium]|nr:GNAT family N-acetyltransferase [Chloroflexota bacterium]